MGLVIGAFFFGLGAWWRPTLAQTARHCVILAFIGLFPTILLGLMDWRHYYAGVWLFPIKVKFLLAGVLLILLSLALFLNRKAQEISGGILLVYTLCLLTVTGLGYLGGKLVFGSAAPGQAAETPELQAGKGYFTQLCSGCHPNGDNLPVPELPLKTSPRLADFSSFLAFIRNPTLRDGSPGPMPAFTAEKLSEQQARQLYQYIAQVLKES
jgi:mono/diheme cytochrome c family protein